MTTLIVLYVLAVSVGTMASIYGNLKILSGDLESSNQSKMQLDSMLSSSSEEEVIIIKKIAFAMSITLELLTFMVMANFLMNVPALIIFSVIASIKTYLIVKTIDSIQAPDNVSAFVNVVYGVVIIAGFVLSFPNIVGV